MSEARVVGALLFQVGEELLQRAVIARVELVIALRVVILAIAAGLAFATLVIALFNEVL